MAARASSTNSSGGRCSSSSPRRTRNRPGRGPADVSFVSSRPRSTRDPSRVTTVVYPSRPLWRNSVPTSATCCDTYLYTVSGYFSVSVSSLSRPGLDSSLNACVGFRFPAGTLAPGPGNSEHLPARLTREARKTERGSSSVEKKSRSH
ncbi:MAG: hypothetical protein J07HR59_00439 [Halorubrum sp. J07HR59]|nr:MAG: hypothetical protein J07HR59_00439 [Halorubrum sp. J07HR59]